MHGMNTLRKQREAMEFLSQYRKGEDGYDLEAVHAALMKMPVEKARRVWPLIRREAGKRILHLEENLRELNAKIETLRELDPEFDAMREWVKGDLSLEKPSGSALHHLRQDLRDGNAVFLKFTDYSPDDFDTALSEANCFVVEHDWSRAFAGATDFSEGEFRLPYDNCVFEFRVGGWRVVALMTTVDDVVMMQLMARGAGRWLLDDDIARHDNGKWTLWHAGRAPEKNMFQPIVEFVGAHVRAISIALDAEVAETEVIRAPSTLAKSREKAGKVPPKPYHVVSLARRSRAVPLPSTGEGAGTRKRLHFRRGHWRHFETHKTWVRWCLVGDPELGFVDKEYRL